MRGLYSYSREYRKIFLRSHFLHISKILEGNYFGAYTCRACICTRANTGKYSWGIIYVLVSCQGVDLAHFWWWGWGSVLGGYCCCPQKHYIHKKLCSELFFSPGYNYNDNVLRLWSFPLPGPNLVKGWLRWQCHSHSPSKPSTCQRAFAGATRAIVQIPPQDLPSTKGAKTTLESLIDEAVTVVKMITIA